MDLFGVAILSLLLLGGGLVWINIRRPYKRVAERVRVARTIADALARYHAQANQYPVRHNFSPLYGNTGDAVRRWLPELGPSLKRLPGAIDNNDNGLGQWLYRSDGQDFKLIFHEPTDIEQRIVLQKFRSLADPERISQKSVRAFGYWSPGAIHW